MKSVLKVMAKVHRIGSKLTVLSLIFMIEMASNNALAANAGKDLSDLYSRLKPTVVTIHGIDTKAGTGSVGSGVIVDKTGRIFTASHVVHSADRIVVTFASGVKLSADVIASNQSADIALLKLKSTPSDLVVAKLGDSDTAKIGSQVIVIGAPFGLSHSLSVGYISGRQDNGQVTDGELVGVIQTDAAINQGNSGGPLFDLDGKVIGIVSSILSRGGGSDGIGFAVAINPARRILLENSMFWTGFEGIFLGPEFAATLNVAQGGGLLVQHVQSDSIAGRAGLRGGSVHASLFDRDFLLGGDIILSIQGTSCTAPHDFSTIRAELSTLSPNETFSMVVLRKGEEVTLTGYVNAAAWNGKLN